MLSDASRGGPQAIHDRAVLILSATYNQAVWPLQVLAYVAGLLVLELLLQPARVATLTIASVLTSFWTVNSLGYHWTWLATISPIARVIGAIFIHTPLS